MRAIVGYTSSGNRLSPVVRVAFNSDRRDEHLDEIDERVLCFLARQPSSMPPSWEWRLELRPTVPSTEIDGLDERQIDDGMLRLESAHLVAGKRTETVGFASWSRPRVTALGSMVLGVWPDLQHVDALVAMQVSLAALAEQEADPEQRSALRRGAGLLASLSASIATRVVAGAAGEAGGEIA